MAWDFNTYKQGISPELAAFLGFNPGPMPYEGSGESYNPDSDLFDFCSIYVAPKEHA